MSITIIKVINGYVVQYYEEDGVYQQFVYQESHEAVGARQESKKHVLDLLYSLVDLLGENGSRYDKERISIALIPGDKYEGSGSDQESSVAEADSVGESSDDFPDID